eukprot:1229079-Pleurochrysis_carterae.AAC.1
MRVRGARCAARSTRFASLCGYGCARPNACAMAAMTSAPVHASAPVRACAAAAREGHAPVHASAACRMRASVGAGVRADCASARSTGKLAKHSGPRQACDRRLCVSARGRTAPLRRCAAVRVASAHRRLCPTAAAAPRASARLRRRRGR